MPTRILALLILLIALVAAGCGGGDDKQPAKPAAEALSSEEYIDEINKAQTTFAEAAGKLNLADPNSPGAFADSIEQLGSSVDELVAQLEAIEPPVQIADLHQKLIDEMSGYNDTIGENIDGLRSEDTDKVQTAAVNIGEASNGFSENFSGLVTQINEQLGSK